MSKSITRIKASQIARTNVRGVEQPHHRQTEAELLGISDSDYRKAVLITLSAIQTILAKRA